MANRFNQFVRTDYIGLPVDYYQMGLSAQEQESGQQLQQAKLAYDTAHNINAVYNPDKQLKNYLLGDVETKIKELATKRLNGRSTLMRLNSIVNDNDLIDKLAGIQSNSINYQKAIEKVGEYRKKYGNDVNLQSFADQIANYDKQGKEGFKGNFLSGYEPDAYVDVVGELQKVLKDSGVNAENITYEDGNYFVTVNNKKRALNDLLKDAGVMLNDPKYQTQIKNYIYYQASHMGNGDVNKGFEVGKEQYISTLQDRISVLRERAGLIVDNDKKSKQLKEEYSKEIAKINKEIEDTINTDAATVFNRGVKENFAMMAAAPFDFKETGRKIEYTPAYLTRLRSSLQDQNNARQSERTRRNAFALWDYKRKTAEEENRVMPNSISFQMKDENGNTITTPITFFSKEAGFEMGAMSQLVTAALSSQSQFYDADGKKYDVKTTGFLGQKGEGQTKRETLMSRVKDGSAQIGFSPGTKDLIIVADGTTYRVKAPIELSRSMENLHAVMQTGLEYTPTPKRITIPSSDLKGRVPAFAFSIRDDQGNLISKVMVQDGKELDLTKATQQEFNQMAGIEFKGNTFKNEIDGFYVAVDGDFTTQTGNIKQVESYKTYMPYDKYRKLLLNGTLVPRVSNFVYKQGMTAYPVDEADIGEAGSKLTRAELQQQSQTGGNLQYIRSREGSKRFKSSSSSSQGFKIEMDEDEDEPFSGFNTNF